MPKIAENGLALDSETGALSAIYVNSFKSGLAEGENATGIIFRLYEKGQYPEQGDLPSGLNHQFVVSPEMAARLGRHLLELSAQVEKESGVQSH